MVPARLIMQPNIKLFEGYQKFSLHQGCLLYHLSVRLSDVIVSSTTLMLFMYLFIAVTVGPIKHFMKIEVLNDIQMIYNTFKRFRYLKNFEVMNFSLIKSIFASLLEIILMISKICHNRFCDIFPRSDNNFQLIRYAS